MGLLDSLENIGSDIVHGAESVVGGVANAAEGVVGGAVNLAGGVLNSAEGLVCPLLSDALGPLGSILSSLLGQHSSPLPFSGAASLINDPAQFATNLSGAASSLGQGLDLSGVGQLEQQADAAQQKAASSGSVQDAIAAQEAAEKLNQVASVITTALSEKSNLDDKIANNLRTQG